MKWRFNELRALKTSLFESLQKKRCNLDRCVYFSWNIANLGHWHHGCIWTTAWNRWSLLCHHWCFVRRCWPILLTRSS